MKKISEILNLQLFKKLFDCIWNSSKVLFAQTNQAKWLHQLPIATIERTEELFTFSSQKSKRKRRRSKNKKQLFFFSFRGEKKMSKNFAQKDIKWTEADSIEMVTLVICNIYNELVLKQKRHHFDRNCSKYLTR